jgi:DNA-binding NarL/FixJ family response regulator
VVDRHRPDVVLMDVRMERLNGVAATRLLQAQPDPPAVVVVTTFDTPGAQRSTLRLAGTSDRHGTTRQLVVTRTAPTRHRRSDPQSSARTRALPGAAGALTR